MKKKLASSPAGNLPLLTQGKSTVFTKWIGKVEVKPRDQQRITLGHFTKDHPAKGFSIASDPEQDPDSPDVVSVITRSDEGDSYTLVLHIANYGSRVVEVEVWGME